jgi:hypothetical protein
MGAKATEFRRLLLLYLESEMVTGLAEGNRKFARQCDNMSFNLLPRDCPRDAHICKLSHVLA